MLDLEFTTDRNRRDDVETQGSNQLWCNQDER
jgi:hypothetical protein